MRILAKSSVFFALLVVLGGSLAMDSNAQRSRKPRRQLLSREAAVDRLGKNLGEVAKRFQIGDENRLRHALLRDRTLRLSVRPIEPPPPNGKVALPNDAEEALLLFADEVPGEALTAGDAELPLNPQVSQIPDSKTFQLHSNPGARSVLHINFKGVTVTSEDWNDGETITAAPYSRDADPAYSTDDYAAMKAIWLQVAEDYSPFDIDVTTEKPAKVDASHYIVVHVTPTRSWYPNAGGVCYVGSFSWKTLDGKMCWVFPPALSNNVRYVAEAVSHEAGHSMGLYHWSEFDSGGTLKDSYYKGTSIWAPIMGASYTAGVSTWCKGDYPQAGTTLGHGKLQNDMNVIQAKIGSSVVDEAGSDKNGAAPIASTSSGSLVSVAQAGIITSQTDLDVYRMEVTGGDLQLAVKPASAQPNLDFLVRVLNASGQVLFNQNPEKVASVNVVLPGLAAGQYFLEVSPVGYGDPSTGKGYPAYSSNGRYSIVGSFGGMSSTPTPPPAPTPTATPTPTPVCVRDGWSSVTCNGIKRVVVKVSVQ